MRKATPYVEPTATCSIERSVEVLGERWTFLILRQAHGGTTRFADFRDELGIAPNLLATRLEKLVSAGVMERLEYRAPGERTRLDYHLTKAGVDLRVVLGALQQWGDLYLPNPPGPTMMRRDARTDKAVGVAFIDDEGHAIETENVYLVNPTEDD
jgi:DNA-binding HxlR family transcriptional regulator